MNITWVALPPHQGKERGWGYYLEINWQRYANNSALAIYCKSVCSLKTISVIEGGFASQ